MKQQTNLPDILCDLYLYNERLKAAFDNEEVPPEAVSIMCKTASLVDLQRLARLAEEENFSWETMRLGFDFPADPHLEMVVIDAISEAEEVVRQRHAETQTPCEKSQAWLCAARWLANKTGFTLEELEPRLGVFCHGLAEERRLTHMKASSRLEWTDFVRALAKRRSHDEQFEKLADWISRLDTAEKVRELLKLLWEQWRTEAEESGLPEPEETQKQQSPDRQPLGGGMSWQNAKKKAEEHVKRNGYPGFKSLGRAVGCGVGTLTKAINNSTFLKARKAEYEANKKGNPHETPLTDVVLDNAVQSTEIDPSGALMLEELIDEQEADRRRDARLPRSRASE